MPRRRGRGKPRGRGRGKSRPNNSERQLRRRAQQPIEHEPKRRRRSTDPVFEEHEEAAVNSQGESQPTGPHQISGQVMATTEPKINQLVNQKAKEDQVHMMRDEAIQNIKLELQQTIQFKSNHMRGGVFLPTSNLAFGDYNNDCLLIYKLNGTLNTEVSLKSMDITCIDDKTIAVSGYITKTISIIDLTENIIVKTIETDSTCSGLTYSDGKLIFCGSNQGVQVINLSDYKMSILHENKRLDYGYCYITTVGDRICYTDYNKQTVTAIGFDGSEIFNFSDPSFLKYPAGIAMDENMNIYVVGVISKNLVVISPDGKQSRQLLGEKDGLCGPMAVHYNKTTKQILVTNYYNEKAFIFNKL